jgi:hypothetical protein
VQFVLMVKVIQFFAARLLKARQTADLFMSIPALVQDRRIHAGLVEPKYP